MSTPTNPPAPPPAQKIDPIISALSKSFEKIIEPTAATPPPDPAKLDEPAKDSSEGVTLGDVVERRHLKPKEEPKPEEKAAAATPPPEDPPVTPPVAPAEPAKPAAKKAQVKRSTADELAEKLKLQQTSPLPPAPASPAPADPLPKAEDHKDDDLTNEEREELQFAEWVEKNRPEHKGKAAETRTFLKKVKDYIEKHPVLTPGTEEHDDYQKFLDANRPKYKSGERRQLEREQWSSEATEKASKAADEKINATKAEMDRRMFELEAKPKLEKDLKEFTQTFGTDAPEAERVIDPGLVKEFTEKGYEAISAKAPIEAPIIAGSINAAEAYLRIQHGIEPINLSNGTHLWLADFLDTQSNDFVAKSKPSDRVRDGKNFLPWVDYYALAHKNPAEAKKHWTFSRGEVLQLIDLNAQAGVKAKYAELEKAGFSRKKNPDPATQPPPVPPITPPESAPKSGSGLMPGAAPSALKTNPNAKFIDTLVPGSSAKL